MPPKRTANDAGLRAQGGPARRTRQASASAPPTNAPGRGRGRGRGGTARASTRVNPASQASRNNAASRAFFPQAAQLADAETAAQLANAGASAQVAAAEAATQLAAAQAATQLAAAETDAEGAEDADSEEDSMDLNDDQELESSAEPEQEDDGARSEQEEQTNQKPGKKSADKKRRQALRAEFANVLSDSSEEEQKPKGRKQRRKGDEPEADYSAAIRAEFERQEASHHRNLTRWERAGERLKDSGVDIDNFPLYQGAKPTRPRAGQACDRCQALRRACDRNAECCESCRADEKQCFTTNKNTGITSLRGELTMLRRERARHERQRENWNRQRQQLLGQLAEARNDNRIAQNIIFELDHYLWGFGIITSLDVPQMQELVRRKGYRVREFPRPNGPPNATNRGLFFNQMMNGGVPMGPPAQHQAGNGGHTNQPVHDQGMGPQMGGTQPAQGQGMGPQMGGTQPVHGQGMGPQMGGAQPAQGQGMGPQMGGYQPLHGQGMGAEMGGMVGTAPQDMYWHGPYQGMPLQNDQYFPQPSVQYQGPYGYGQGVQPQGYNQSQNMGPPQAQQPIQPQQTVPAQVPGANLPGALPYGAEQRPPVNPPQTGTGPAPFQPANAGNNLEQTGPAAYTGPGVGSTNPTAAPSGQARAPRNVFDLWLEDGDQPSNDEVIITGSSGLHGTSTIQESLLNTPFEPPQSFMDDNNGADGSELVTQAPIPAHVPSSGQVNASRRSSKEASTAPVEAPADPQAADLQPAPVSVPTLDLTEEERGIENDILDIDQEYEEMAVPDPDPVPAQAPAQAPVPSLNPPVPSEPVSADPATAAPDPQDLHYLATIYDEAQQQIGTPGYDILDMASGAVGQGNTPLDIIMRSNYSMLEIGDAAERLKSTGSVTRESLSPALSDLDFNAVDDWIREQNQTSGPAEETREPVEAGEEGEDADADGEYEADPATDPLFEDNGEADGLFEDDDQYGVLPADAQGVHQAIAWPDEPEASQGDGPAESLTEAAGAASGDWTAGWGPQWWENEEAGIYSQMQAGPSELDDLINEQEARDASGI